jgi:hypothetical protein
MDKVVIKEGAYSAKMQWLKGCRDKMCKQCRLYLDGCTKPGYPGKLVKKV